MSIKTVSLLDKRVIEATQTVSLVKAFCSHLSLDMEQGKAIVQAANEASSKDYGRQRATELGSQTLADLAHEMTAWAKDGALEEEVLALNEKEYRLNVTRCLYAERYKALGFLEFGHCLSCCRDQPFVEGFNPEIKFERTQTIMEGADYCDFKFTL